MLDPLDVEEVLEQRSEPTRLSVDDPEVVPADRWVELALQEEGGEAEHACERRPQLVGDDADELRLHSLALAQLGVLRLELCVVLLDPLRHLVEGLGELADLAGPCSGSRSDHSPAASRLAPEATARTGRPIERERKTPKRMISAAEAPMPTAPTMTARLDRLSASRPASAASASSAVRKRSNTFWISSVNRFPSSATSGSLPIEGVSFTSLTSGYDEFDVLPDPLLHLLCPPALHRVVHDERLQGGSLLGQRLERVGVRLEELRVRVSVRPRIPVSMSTTSFSRRSEAAVTSRERASRAVASRCAVMATISADERSDDDECERDAREPHPAGERHPSSSSTAPLSSSGSNGFETKRSAPATRASSSA